ncbi:MAG: acetate--CoA ligase family protein [Gomphosphaeria aponina SAG 52.96 = DSM 107014]|uniref:Acetate--CoA ligase family protein n=1 Tax=Gomphosphaeria aponina SAG 52.96 = DSM 107014 TaxID=1521640 RepID=A0A941GVS6_9CHRO|nr:acetate--CoA ligase family protein [Gomphosphaeria aponina SAG 52.96 = DSM 107014]
MELLEYQAKALFDEIGIPILPSVSIKNPRDLKQLQIPYPVVLKSQVRAGGRGRAGGVRFVDNTIDAIAAAQAIFNLSIMGEYPQVLLAEARYNAEQEFFLAIVLDYQLRLPVLLGSAQGGINVEALLEQMQMVVVENEFSPFYARHLTKKMGLTGKLIHSVSTIIEKMYYLFREKDLDIVEINPLGVGTDGKVMALDGKISVNDYALGRHGDILKLTTPTRSDLRSAPVSSPPLSLNGVEKNGEVGIIANSTEIALATWDLITREKKKISCCLVVGETPSGRLVSPTFLAQQLEVALEEALAVEGLQVLLINILGNAATTETVAEAIADYFQPPVESTVPGGEERMERPTGYLSRKERKPGSQAKSSKGPIAKPVGLVIRLVGGNIDPMKERLASTPVYWTENLEKAISKTISGKK